MVALKVDLWVEKLVVEWVVLLVVELDGMKVDEWDVRQASEMAVLTVALLVGNSAVEMADSKVGMMVESLADRMDDLSVAARVVKLVVWLGVRKAVAKASSTAATKVEHLVVWMVGLMVETWAVKWVRAKVVELDFVTADGKAGQMAGLTADDLVCLKVA
jgi:hypothetical protein